MTKRTYAQRCALATALDIIGERWSLLIIRELLVGPRRYSDLLAGLRGIGTNLLASRLKELESAGIVAREVLPPPAASRVYGLTASGKGLAPAIHELIRWGSLLPAIGSPDAHSRPEWDILALRSLLETRDNHEIGGRFQFYVDEISYYIDLESTVPGVELGKIGDPDVTIITSREILLRLRDNIALSTAVEEKIVEVQGNIRLLENLISHLGEAKTGLSESARIKSAGN